MLNNILSVLHFEVLPRRNHRQFWNVQVGQCWRMEGMCVQVRSPNFNTHAIHVIISNGLIRSSGGISHVPHSIVTSFISCQKCCKSFFFLCPCSYAICCCPSKSILWNVIYFYGLSHFRDCKKLKKSMPTSNTPLVSWKQLVSSAISM